MVFPVVATAAFFGWVVWLGRRRYQRDNAARPGDDLRRADDGRYSVQRPQDIDGTGGFV